MSHRTLFGKPLRDISLHCHRYKISREKFIEQMKNGLDGWNENMIWLEKTRKSQGAEMPEVWIEQFLAWFELEQETE